MSKWTSACTPQVGGAEWVCSKWAEGDEAASIELLERRLARWHKCVQDTASPNPLGVSTDKREERRAPHNSQRAMLQHHFVTDEFNVPLHHDADSDHVSHMDDDDDVHDEDDEDVVVDIDDTHTADEEEDEDEDDEDDDDDDVAAFLQ